MARRGVLAAFGIAAGLCAIVYLATKPAARRPPGDARFLTLGELAAELAGDPKTFDALLDRLGGGPTSAGLIGDVQRAAMRRLFQAADYDGLDREPRLTLETLESGLELLARHRSAGPKTPESGPADAGLCGKRPPPGTVDAGRGSEPLGIPSGVRVADGEPLLRPLGLGIFHGERVDRKKAGRFCDSARLADVLERLSASADEQGPAFQVGDVVVRTPEELVRALLHSGHRVEVRDERFLANFGDVERQGKPVATPLWVAAGPGDLHLPVPHAQVVLSLRGPEVNTDVTLYTALDLAGTGGGGTRFRADVAHDPPWVGGRIAHRWEGEAALEAFRWMVLLRRAADSKVREHRLPLNGYFALGVCTLAPAVVERALTGTTTLWPLTQNRALFSGESELDRLVAALPSDVRAASPPGKDRLRGAVPWERPGEIPLVVLREAATTLW